MKMIAGRSPWLCHGTTPPGWITSRRKRSARPSICAGSLARSIDASTVSVTSFAASVLGFVTLVPTLSAGHWPALAALTIDKAPSIMLAADSSRQSPALVILFICFLLVVRLRPEWPQHRRECLTSGWLLRNADWLLFR